MTATRTVADRIRHLHPCEEALVWAAEPWSDQRKPLVACAMDCALIARRYWPAKQKDQIARAVRAIQAWTRGNVSVERAQEARKELYAASDASDASAASAASDAAASAASDAAARAKALARCAAIVRKHYPRPPVITADLSGAPQ